MARSSRILLVFLAAVFAATAHVTAASSWTADGAPVAPADSIQSNPVIASDGADGVYIAFEGSNKHRSFAQRLLHDGTVAPGWNASGLRLPVRFSSSHVPWFQRANPTIVADGHGGALIADDGNFDFSAVTLNRVNGTGLSTDDWPAGGVLVTGQVFAAHDQSQPTTPESPRTGDYFASVCLDGAGGVFVAWDYYTPCCERIHLTRVSSTGQRSPGWPATGLQIDQFGYFPVVCPDGSSGAFVVWRRYHQALGYRIHAQHVLPDGVLDSRWPAGGLVVADVPGRQDAPALVSDGEGGFLLAWQDARDGGVKKIYAQRVQADGTLAPGWPAGGRVVVSHATAPGTSRPHELGCCVEYTSMIADGAGGAYLAWTDFRAGTGGRSGDIYAHRIQSDGSIAPGWAENGNPVCVASDRQALPRIAPSGSDGVLIAWQDERGIDQDIYAQHLTGTGSRAAGWSENGTRVCAAQGVQETPVIVASGEERAIVAWVDRRGTFANVYATAVGPDDQVPVLVSLVSAEADVGVVRIVWYLPEPSARWLVFRSGPAEGWRTLATVSPDGEGRVVFEDRDVIAGKSYRYRIGLVPDAEQASGEAEVQIPVLSRFAIEGVTPNPVTQGQLQLSFQLPRSGAVDLEAFDVTGRRVAHRRIEGARAGRNIARVAALPAGILVLRLSQDGESATRRVCVLD